MIPLVGYVVGAAEACVLFKDSHASVRSHVKERAQPGRTGVVSHREETARFIRLTGANRKMNFIRAHEEAGKHISQTIQMLPVASNQAQTIAARRRRLSCDGLRIRPLHFIGVPSGGISIFKIVQE